MDNNTLFHHELVALNIQAADHDEVIRRLGDLLVAHHYATKPYVDAVIQREQESATGLPTRPLGIAIPHADPEHVLESGVAVGVLTRPVAFGAMGNPDQTIPASLVFLMAVKEPDEQISRLQQLVQLFRQPEILDQLTRADSPEAIIEILTN